MKVDRDTLEVMSANSHAINPIEIIDQMIALWKEGKAWSLEFGILLFNLVMYLINRAADDSNSPDGLISQQQDDPELVAKLFELIEVMDGEDVASSFPKSGSLPFLYKIVIEFLISRFLEWLADQTDPSVVDQIKDWLYAFLEKITG